MVAPITKQTFTYFGMSSINFMNGYTIGLISIMMPSLRKSSDIQLTAEQESWIPAVLLLMMFPSQLTSGLSTKRFGRKLLIVISFIFPIFSCILFFLARNYTMLLLASTLAGCIGGGMSISHMMVAETVAPNLRGVFLNSKSSFGIVGMSLIHILGNYLDWRTIAIVGVVPCILGLLISLIVPESPAWLAMRGDFNKSTLSFKWFRGDEGEDELKELITAQRKNLTDKDIEIKNKESRFLRFSKFISDKGFLKATGISIASVLLIEASGKQIFGMFAVDLITKISGNVKVNPYTIAIVFDVIDLFGFVISCVAVKTLRRRTLLFATGIPGNVLLFLFCLLSYLGANGIIGNLALVSFATIGLYFLFVSIGIAPIAITLMGEIYPLSHRGEGVAITSFVFGSLLFVIAKFAPKMITDLDIHGTFLIHAMFLTTSLVYLYYSLPETNLKTLQRIEDEIKGNIMDNEMNEEESKPFQPPI